MIKLCNGEVLCSKVAEEARQCESFTNLYWENTLAPLIPFDSDAAGRIEYVVKIYVLATP